MAEGRVKWAFWPPGTDPSIFKSETSDGVWLPQSIGGEEQGETESDDDGDNDLLSSEEGSEALEEETSDIDEEEASETPVTVGAGRFGALVLDEDEDDADEDDADEDEDDKN